MASSWFHMRKFYSVLLVVFIVFVSSCKSKSQSINGGLQTSDYQTGKIYCLVNDVALMKETTSREFPYLYVSPLTAPGAKLARFGTDDRPLEDIAGVIGRVNRGVLLEIVKITERDGGSYGRIVLVYAVIKSGSFAGTECNINSISKDSEAPYGTYLNAKFMLEVATLHAPARVP
jgi:hypothetical protein